MNDEDRKNEETDLPVYEGKPDFEESPSKNTVQEVQDEDDIDPDQGGQVVGQPEGVDLALPGSPDVPVTPAPTTTPTDTAGA